MRYRYAGKEWDEESGLYYFGARYYRAEVGLWLSPDPEGARLASPMEGGAPRAGYSLAEATIWYGYCSYNPLRYVDPDGRDDVVTGEQVYARFYEWQAQRPEGSPVTDDVVLNWLFGRAIGGELPLVEEIQDQVAMAEPAAVAYQQAGLMLLGGISFNRGNLLALDNSPKTRVFWSGGREIAGKAAMEWAKENGGITLEMTFGGRLMEGVGRFLPRSLQVKIWGLLSRRFAAGAKGRVYCFQNATGVSLRSFWATQEYPILSERGIEIIYKLVK